jgi:serine kinase of HPr protein (carbohydrate metabolism regulator)
MSNSNREVDAKTLLHATTVAIDGHAVVIRGAAGSGKSDLALRLIDRGAVLIADDQTALRRQGATLRASAPATIAGQLEARGLGVVTLPAVADVAVRLVVDLVPPQLIERLPRPASETLLGVKVPLLLLAPFEGSATAKLRRAVAAATGAVQLARD